MASKLARYGELPGATREARKKLAMASDEVHYSRGEDHCSLWRAMNVAAGRPVIFSKIQQFSWFKASRWFQNLSETFS